jgi:hypothetical protein
MEGDKKEPSENKKRRSAPKTSTQSPSRSARASPSSSGHTSPKRPRKTDSQPIESAWVPATVLRSPRGHKRSNSGADGLTDEVEGTLTTKTDIPDLVTTIMFETHPDGTCAPRNLTNKICFT